MGQSTDAYVAYGFKLKAEGEDELHELLGFDDEQLELIEDGELDVYEWFEARFPGLSLERHCSAEYPMYIVAVADSTRSASRGEPEDLYPRDMVDKITPAMERKLRACATNLGIDQPEIGWLLYSYWG